MTKFVRPLMIRKTFHIREDVIDRLTYEAARQDTSEATIVRQALNGYFLYLDKNKPTN